MDSYYSDPYSYTTYSTDDAALATGVSLVFGFVFFIFFVAIYVVMALCLM